MSRDVYQRRIDIATVYPLGTITPGIRGVNLSRRTFGYEEREARPLTGLTS